jgi:hypothetical protein
MHGNVWEWCEDEEKEVDGTSLRAIRGGTWYIIPWQCRAAMRHANPPDFRDGGVGLRVARVRVGSNADPDRRAAERLIAYAQLTVRFKNGSSRMIDRGEPLPAEPFFLTYLFIPFGAKDADDLMNQVIVPEVKGLTKLQAISSAEGFVPCSDEVLEQLLHSSVGKQLRVLNMKLSLSPRTFDLLQQFPELRGVTLHVREGDSELLGRLAELPQFSDLTVIGPTTQSTTAELVEPLARLNLKRFALIKPDGVDQRLIEALAKQPELRYVEFYSAGLTDGDAQALGSLKQVEELILTQNRLSDAALSALTDLAKLRRLRVARNEVTAEGLHKLAAALPKCRIEHDGGVIDPGSAE